MPQKTELTLHIHEAKPNVGGEDHIRLQAAIDSIAHLAVLGDPEVDDAIGREAGEEAARTVAQGLVRLKEAEARHESRENVADYDLAVGLADLLPKASWIRLKSENERWELSYEESSAGERKMLEDHVGWYSPVVGHVTPVVIIGTTKSISDHDRHGRLKKAPEGKTFLVMADLGIVPQDADEEKERNSTYRYKLASKEPGIKVGLLRDKTLQVIREMLEQGISPHFLESDNTGIRTGSVEYAKKHGIHLSYCNDVEPEDFDMSEVSGFTSSNMEAELAKLAVEFRVSEEFVHLAEEREALREPSPMDGYISH